MSPTTTVSERGNPKTEIELLSQAECDAIRTTVHGLKLYWEPAKAQDSPFFKLGASSYVDMRTSETSFKYYALARTINPILQKHFDYLYARLSAALEACLGQPNQYHPNHVGLPGFHIYKASTGLETFDTPVHVDGQVKKVNFESLGPVDASKSVSFTLPIAIPKAGAGLNMWDMTLSDIESKRENFQEMLDRADFHYQEYRIGTLFTHCGNYFHQVAPLKDLEAGDERITLQGHAVWSEGTWILFW